MIYSILLLLACSPSTEDSGSKEGEKQPPSYVSPQSFQLAIDGTSTHNLTFSEHDCSNNNNQIRSFWRGSNHVFVLIAEIMSDYEGVGNYTTENSTVRVKLQEEAGGNGSFYQATDDDISIDVQFVGSEGTSGMVFVSTLEGGSLTLDPTEFYFGCNKSTE
jgi:hypothetical protein